MTLAGPACPETLVCPTTRRHSAGTPGARPAPYNARKSPSCTTETSMRPSRS